MAPEPQEVRKFIFDYFLENCKAPVLEEVMGRFGMNREKAAKSLEDLEVAHHVVRLPGTNRILMANPFSALDTPFRVTARGKHYFAPCAWDSVAYHVMLGEETRVDSFCHHCAEPISIDFKAGIPSTTPSKPVVYLSLPASKWWDDIVTICANHMVFFSSEEHLQHWLAGRPGPSGVALTIGQTLKISVPLYRDKMKLDYVRPPKEELMAYWNSMGLEGDFWKL